MTNPIRREDRDSHVYIHLDADWNLLYVGRTSDPKHRPTQKRSRPWLNDPATTVRVSPAMPHDAAVFAERALIHFGRPQHNVHVGYLSGEQINPEVVKYAELKGVTRAVARVMVETYGKRVS